MEKQTKKRKPYTSDLTDERMSGYLDKVAKLGNTTLFSSEKLPDTLLRPRRSF